jgi:uncharacterized protein YqgC (DUF456 family)
MTFKKIKIYLNEKRKMVLKVPHFGFWSIGGDKVFVPAVGLMVANFITEKWAPEAKGHGVPEVMGAVAEDRGKIRPVGARHYAARAQLLQNVLGVFNSPIGQMISPHVSPKMLAVMVEEYMGFDRYGFIKDNAAIFEMAEQEKIKMQIQQDLQGQQEAPSMDEQMVNQQIDEVDQQADAMMGEEDVDMQ